MTESETPSAETPASEAPAAQAGAPTPAATSGDASAAPQDAAPPAEPKQDAAPQAEAKQDAAPQAEAKQDAAPQAEAKQDAAPQAEAKLDAAPRVEAKQDAAPQAEAKLDAAPQAEAKQDAAPQAEGKKKKNKKTKAEAAAAKEAAAKQAAPAEESNEPRFADLGLHPELARAVAELGYESPTPIQAGAIPPLLAGRDLLGQAQTGTGKTAAFALPLLHRIDPERRGVQAIVLTPTRELALQVAEAVRAYGKHLGERGVQVLPVYGGAPYHPQLKALRRGVPVVIGTPGRVKDHLERGSLDLSNVCFFGLDEADEMLKMGFIDDVEWILEHAPDDAQTALFSATMPRPIRRVADRFLTDPADIKIKQKTLTVANCEQLSLRLGGLQAKNFAVERILEAEEHEAVLIFTRTQMATADLAERLMSRGYPAEAIHGGMSQANREAVVRRLRARATQVVVATDVAARGLDVDHITLVINFDIPRDQEIYVHRVGRTGRAGRTGKAITFWQPREQRLLRSIERYSGQQMTPTRLPQQCEVLDIRRARLAQQIVELSGEGLEDFKEWVDAFGNELDPSQIAAAALRLAWGDGPLSVPPEPERKQREPRDRRDREDRPRRERDDTDFGPETEIVLPIGRMGRVRPGDIVGAIANEADLPGSVVGNINIVERVTFVSVPTQHVERILEALEGVRIRGRVIHPRRAEDRPPRDQGGDDRGGGGGGYRGGGGGYRNDRNEGGGYRNDRNEGGGHRGGGGGYRNDRNEGGGGGGYRGGGGGGYRNDRNEVGGHRGGGGYRNDRNEGGGGYRGGGGGYRNDRNEGGGHRGGGGGYRNDRNENQGPRDAGQSGGGDSANRPGHWESRKKDWQKKKNFKKKDFQKAFKKGFKKGKGDEGKGGWQKKDSPPAGD